jgi:hypothetical protein
MCVALRGYGMSFARWRQRQYEGYSFDIALLDERRRYSPYI